MSTPGLRHLILVSMYYAPELSGSAPYVTQLAEYLTQNGWRVTALVGVPHYPKWRVEPSYKAVMRAQEERGGVQLRRYRHFVPRHPTVVKRAIYEASFYLNCASSRFPPAHAVVGVIPGMASALLAGKLASRIGCPYGLIFQDLLAKAASQSGTQGAAAVEGIVRHLEGAAARGASGVGVVSERFRGYLSELGIPDHRITHLPNWTLAPATPNQASAARGRMGWSAGDVVVLHAGNQGQKQGLEHLLSAARIAGQVHPRFRFVLMGDGNARSELVRTAREWDLRNVAFLQSQPDDLFHDVLGAADVLLVHERPGATDMSLPSKLTAYFAAGRPVVAAVEPDGATAEEVARSKAGVVVPAGDSSALLEALRRISVDHSLRDSLGRSGREYARRYLSPSTLLPAAEEFVASLTERGSRGH